MNDCTIKSPAVTRIMVSAMCILGFSCLFPGAHAQKLQTEVRADGSYSISVPGEQQPVLISEVAAKIEGRWIRARDYPKHTVHQDSGQGYLGEAREWQVTFSGLRGAPDLAYRLRSYETEPFSDIQVFLTNNTNGTLPVQAIRVVDAEGSRILDLGDAAGGERVLSDSFSEDRPAMRIYNLADGPGGMHRGVGSQLIYNRKSRLSFFAGALSADRFLTILRLHLAEPAGPTPRASAYEVDCTGTTEIQKVEGPLLGSAAADQVPLSLDLPAGQSMQSETILLGVSSDYHRQLETYGRLIAKIHQARIAAPPLMGWWSWTAFYYGLNEGAALTNADWLAEHLKSFGYDLFHIDEGYQYARGEYATPNATLFPHGMASLEYRIRGLGLTPGIWTAPFEVSSRSWVYEHHPDWLVKNDAGAPLQIGFVESDKLYVLDTTNPGAEDYLRQTYATLVKDWGIRYIKLDFMDSTAVEGHYYRPATTAMQAQRIGLAIIRKTVGDGVYLDKDGSPMLNPVGIVDYGRISQDTGHSFKAVRAAATGIAARYYMNRNFYVTDPDAFMVSEPGVTDAPGKGQVPLTPDEARVSMALAAISGGMLEIGDDLPTLQKYPERIALLENQDLIDMVRLGRASTPVDLLDYPESAQQPSVFLLNESRRQKILTVFNWTDSAAHRAIELATAGIADAAHISATDVFTGKPCAPDAAGVLHLTLPAHSVAVVKLIDGAIPAVAPEVAIEPAPPGRSGEPVLLAAEWKGGDPALSYRWSLGDGTTAKGRQISHVWTVPGTYAVQMTAAGLGGEKVEKSLEIHITGHMATDFVPGENRRFP